MCRQARRDASPHPYCPHCVSRLFIRDMQNLSEWIYLSCATNTLEFQVPLRLSATKRWDFNDYGNIIIGNLRPDCVHVFIQNVESYSISWSEYTASKVSHVVAGVESDCTDKNKCIYSVFFFVFFLAFQPH